jgi:PAS domain S-box-containing protein
MTSHYSSGLSPRFASFSARMSVVVFGIGVVVLIGWLLNIPVLKSFHPRLLSMKANTAACMALSGMALWLLQTKRAEQRINRRLAQGGALAVMTVGLLTLLEYVFHANFGIDQLLVRETAGAAITGYPGRMYPITALIFLLIGPAFPLLDVETRRGIRPAQFLILLGGALALLGFFGCIYEVFVFFGRTFSFVAMSVPTAVAFLALGAGMMAARPDRGLMTLITSGGPGGVMVRRLLLAVLVLPLAFDLLTLPGEKAGYYNWLTQAALQGLLVIAAFTVIIYQVSRSLERAAEELRDREERFSTLVSNLPIGLFRTHPAADGRVLMANPAIAGMFGYESPEEFMRHGIVETYVDPQDRKQFLDRLFSRGHVEDMALRLKKKDGTLFWGSLTSTVIRNARGEIECLDGMMEDITERKQAEEQLRKLSRAVEQSPASIIITDLRGDIEYVNPKFTDLTGYTLAEAIGKNPRILKSGELSPEAYRDLWKTISSGRKWQGEFHNKKKNGDFFWEFASISPIVDEVGRATHFLAVKEDITLRKQTEAALRESEERLHLATSAASIGIWDWDVVKDRLVWDDSMYRLYGIRREDFAGAYEAWIRCVHPDDAKRAGDAIQAAIRGEKEYAPEFRIVWSDGSIRFIQAASRTFRDKDGKPLRMIGTNIDITGRKQAEAERELLVKSLEESLAKVKTLSGLIPICASCKKIRDDRGFWSQVETYVARHSEAKFSHGICPACAHKLYPELYPDQPPPD